MGQQQQLQQGQQPIQGKREPLLPTPNEMIKLDTGITGVCMRERERERERDGESLYPVKCVIVHNKIFAAFVAGVPVNVMEVVNPPPEDSSECQQLMQRLKVSLWNYVCFSDHFCVDCACLKTHQYLVTFWSCQL